MDVQKELLNIYTDASIKGGYKNPVRLKSNVIGYGSLFVENDDSEFRIKGHISKYHFSKLFNTDINKVSINHGEMFSILRSLETLINKDVKNKKINIFTDSFNSIVILDKNRKIKENPNNYPKLPKSYVNFKELTSSINEKLDYLSSLNNDIELLWIKGHSNIYGNEEADKLASSYNLSYLNVNNLTKKQIQRKLNVARHEFIATMSRNIRPRLPKKMRRDIIEKFDQDNNLIVSIFSKYSDHFHLENEHNEYLNNELKKVQKIENDLISKRKGILSLLRFK